MCEEVNVAAAIIKQAIKDIASADDRHRYDAVDWLCGDNARVLCAWAGLDWGNIMLGLQERSPDLANFAVFQDALQELEDQEEQLSDVSVRFDQGCNSFGVIDDLYGFKFYDGRTPPMRTRLRNDLPPDAEVEPITVSYIDAQEPGR